MDLNVSRAGTCNPQVQNYRTTLKRGRKAPDYFHSFSLQQELGEQHADVTARGSFSPSPEPANLVSRGMHKRHTQTHTHTHTHTHTDCTVSCRTMQHGSAIRSSFVFSVRHVFQTTSCIEVYFPPLAVFVAFVRNEIAARMA
jgi:hypothetical protein